MRPIKPVQHHNLPLAYFISPHGFGHAARASAVMTAMHKRDPKIRFEIFTTVPAWFFEESLCGAFSYHPLLTDIGLAQEGPLRANLPRTVACLDEFLPFDPRRLEALAREVSRLGCGLILCDISPMGIAVAREAGVPSVLVENFTWDWVYREYVVEETGFKPHIAYLEGLFGLADFHIQTVPVCSKGSVHLTTGPVSRTARNSRLQVRKNLGIPAQASMVLITMGGIPAKHEFMDQLAGREDIYFVVPGAGTLAERRKNVLLLPHRSAFFHPDLVHAADAVVGKVGYSTLAEVYHAGVSYGYIKRNHFHESEILSEYIGNYMNGYAIDESGFQSGEWLLRVPDLLDLPRFRGQDPNGAEQAADFVLGVLKGAVG